MTNTFDKGLNLGTHLLLSVGQLIRIVQYKRMERGKGGEVKEVRCLQSCTMFLILASISSENLWT